MTAAVAEEVGAPVLTVVGDPPTDFGPGEPIPAEETFTANDESDFIFDAKLQKVGEHLIKKLPEFVHLRDYRVMFAWKRRGGATRGEPTYGNVVRGNSLLRMLGNTDFVVWLAADHCREIEFTTQVREALIYHQLAHTAADEYGKPFIQGHDFEGFETEIERYGLWSLNLKRAGEVFKQTSLGM